MVLKHFKLTYNIQFLIIKFANFEFSHKVLFSHYLYECSYIGNKHLSSELMKSHLNDLHACIGAPTSPILLRCQSPLKTCQIISLLCSKSSNYWQSSHGLLSPSKLTRLFMFKLAHTFLISPSPMSLSGHCNQFSLLFLNILPVHFESRYLRLFSQISLANFLS